MNQEAQAYNLERRPEAGEKQDGSPQEESRNEITPAELNILLNDHLTLITRMVRRYVGNDADVRDVVQQTALQATLRLYQFRGEASFPTWLVSIAINEACQLLRKQKRQGITMHLEAASWKLADPRASPEEKIRRTQGVTRVRQAVRKLPKIHQTVLQLCDFEEQSVAQAAQLLRLTLAAVKSRRFRARHLLKKQLLRQQGGHPTQEAKLPNRKV